jgi:C4-dicarboxylate-specific signal transduction histidine kinase
LRDRAIKWVDGRVARMVIATDISERRQIAEMAARQQERMDHTTRLISMGEMASSLAHELNQPLAAIANYAMGCVKRLQDDAFDRQEILEAMQKANLQAERAGKIIRRMREFVRKSEPHREAVRLHEIVEETLGLAEIDARKLGIAIHCEVPADLPPVFADRIMIEQVLLNLIRNGIEAMADTPHERRLLSVTAHPAEEGRVEVEIRDHGVGFDAADAERMFSPFFTTKAHGLGMGLNICRSIIEYHRGRLWAQPMSDGGSLFAFSLPLQETQND